MGFQCTLEDLRIAEDEFTIPRFHIEIPYNAFQKHQPKIKNILLI
jgi:hypothetical protein